MTKAKILQLAVHLDLPALIICFAAKEFSAKAQLFSALYNSRQEFHLS